MLKKTQVSVLIALLCASSIVEAGRVGGGRSSGMSRSSSSYSAPARSNNSYTAPTRPTAVPARPATPAPTYNTAQTPEKRKSGPGWGTVAAGAAAGAVAGYALSSAINSPSAPPAAPANAPNSSAVAPSVAAPGVPATANAPAMVQNPLESGHAAPQAVTANSGSSAWLWIVLLLGLLGGGLFLLRRKNGGFAPQGHAHPAAQPAGYAPTTGGNSLFSGQPQTSHDNSSGLFASLNTGTQGSSAAMSGWNDADRLPNGSTVADFLRQARATFQRVQTMNSSMQVNEIRNYLTPELFEALKQDISNNRDIAEFPELHTALLDATDEGQRYIASVRFSGQCSEAAGQPALPFAETWHFVQNKNDVHWKLAGIQQD